MRILYINTLYEPQIGGGAEITLKHLVEGVSGAGHDVGVACLSTNRSFIDLMRNIPVWRVRCWNVYLPYKNKPNALMRYAWQIFDVYNYLARLELRRIIKSFNPDVISFHNLGGWSRSVWDEAFAQGVPTVQVLHDQYLFCPRSAMFRRNRRCVEQCTDCKVLRAHHKSKSHNIDAVVGVSDFILNKFTDAGYFSDARVKVAIRNVRPPNVGSATSPASDGELVFGYIGSIIPAKGVDVMLQAFLTVADNNWRLVIAGNCESDYAKNLQRKFRDPRIAWWGPVRPEKLFSTIDATIVPSVWDEPLGMVAAESLLAGRPVICSDRGGLPEIVEDGKTGILFNPEIQSELESALRQFSIDRLSWSARSSTISKNAVELSDVVAWIGRWEEVYQRAIRER